ncbi:MAG TPA: hypothetical protein VFQ25_07250 [Ktedonobacterales bacterium]|nr:hypothetical protein [Ktedonobacterales bacterium]
MGGVADTGPSQHQVVLRVSPPSSLPQVARWIDVHHGTSYTLALQAGASRDAAGGYRFTFTTPAGDQLAASLPITKLPDGSYTQSTPVDTTTGALTCLKGILRVSKNSGGAQAIVYTLVTRFDQYAMVAYAHLVYALTRDEIGAAGVCSGLTGQGNEQALDMLSGCAASGCTSPVDTAGPTVTAFESSVVGAAKQGESPSWKQIYAGTSRVMTAQYGGDRFGTLIEQQAQKKGRIKSITPSHSSPQIQFDAAGQAYFAVTDSVELDKGAGNTSVVTVTSYYLLESGQWVFWFSMPVGA